MGINLNKWIPLGFKIFLAIPGIVGAVEKSMSDFKGADKKSAAIELVKSSMATAEDLADKDLFNDAAVEKVLGNAIDSAVALQNAIADAKKLKLQKS